MKRLCYATGNATKLLQAQKTCEPLGIELFQATVQIDEIQAASGESVALDKAAKTFAELKTPVVVSDDSWMIPGLNGFPGPYMKYMNEWLSSEDWLRLTNSLEDRRITLRQVVVYQDASQQKLFYVDIAGVLLDEIRGRADQTHDNITSFDGGQTSLGEHIEDKVSITADMPNVWHEFAEWFNAQ